MSERITENPIIDKTFIKKVNNLGFEKDTQLNNWQEKMLRSLLESRK